MYAQDTTESNDAPAIQRGFREIALGDPIEVVQERLLADLAFLYRGEPDVTLRLSDRSPVIDTRGTRYIDRGLFQFNDDQLYILTIYLDRQLLSHFDMFEQLSSRYGQPDYLDPQRAIWEDARTRVELERPLTVRYVDLAVFEGLRGQRRAIDSIEQLTRDQFLEEF